MDDIIQEITIEAPIGRVWQVMTVEGMVDQWLGCIGYKPEIGHVFYMQPDAEKRAQGDMAGATHCELLSLDAPNEMRFSWYYPEMPKTEVALRLSERGGSTRVELVHSGWDKFEPTQIASIREALEGGWKSFVLPQLKQVAEREV